MSRPKISLDGEEQKDYYDEMDIRIETDKFGKTMQFQMFEGRHYIPIYKPRSLEMIKDFKMRDDDIIIIGYPRTGTHWMFEMICMLLGGKAETIHRGKERSQLELTLGVADELLDCFPSPRVINTHMRMSDAPRDLWQRRCKVIYNVRDPRDVMVSLYEVYKDLNTSEMECSFEGFMYLCLEGKVELDGIFEHYVDAEKTMKLHPNVPMFIQVYEETHKDPLQIVRRLSDFIGLPRNEELCRSIVEKCKFEKMKVDKESFTVKVDGKSSLFRKGIVGDWENRFSERMLEDYRRAYEHKMAGSRFYDMFLDRENREQ